MLRQKTPPRKVEIVSQSIENVRLAGKKNDVIRDSSSNFSPSISHVEVTETPESDTSIVSLRKDFDPDILSAPKFSPIRSEIIAAFDGQELVAAVLDHRRTRVAQQLLEGIGAGHAVAAEDLQRLAGHLEGQLSAGDLGGD